MWVYLSLRLMGSHYPLAVGIKRRSLEEDDIPLTQNSLLPVLPSFASLTVPLTCLPNSAAPACCCRGHTAASHPSLLPYCSSRAAWKGLESCGKGGSKRQDHAQALCRLPVASPCFGPAKEVEGLVERNVRSVGRERGGKRCLRDITLLESWRPWRGQQRQCVCAAIKRTNARCVLHMCMTALWCETGGMVMLLFCFPAPLSCPFLCCRKWRHACFFARRRGGRGGGGGKRGDSQPLPALAHCLSDLCFCHPLFL